MDTPLGWIHSYLRAFAFAVPFAHNTFPTTQASREALSGHRLCQTTLLYFPHGTFLRPETTVPPTEAVSAFVAPPEWLSVLMSQPPEPS